jgi:hypothetical protein
MRQDWPALTTNERYSKMAIQEFVPTAESNRFAYGFIEEELETLLCLSIALKRELEPNDPNNPGDEFNATPWRLAQVLNERLSSTAFTSNMRTLLTGEKLN